MNTGALLDLRLHTPRLELRLPSDEELEQLRDVALGGIHPPEEMPFAVAWTDEPGLHGFVDYHRSSLRDWRPDAWNLELAVVTEGALAGVQGATAKDFAHTRAVLTGSWLGKDFQRRGYGTEMRAAILELAFTGLGAEVARSGAIAGNAASARVSEKLGYRIIGESTVSPRGEPLPHTDLELRREDWHPLVPVEIENLEPALPLFGIG